MIPSRNSTCGECWHCGPLSDAEGYCGKLLPETRTFLVPDADGKATTLTATARPIVGLEDPGCHEFRPLDGGGAAPVVSSESWKCKAAGCGWPAVDAGGYCEECLSGDDGDDEESSANNDRF